MTDRPASMSADFVTLIEASRRRGFSRRTANNRVLDHAIGFRAGGKWYISERGLDALAFNDTGALCDEQRRIANMVYAD